MVAVKGFFLSYFSVGLFLLLSLLLMSSCFYMLVIHSFDFLPRHRKTAKR